MHVKLNDDSDDDKNYKTTTNSSKKDKGSVYINKIIQKTTIDVFLDPFWAITAGEELEIFPIIKIESNGEGLKIDKKFLKVGATNTRYRDTYYDYSNTAVLVGKIETNIKSFDACRYVSITGGYEGEKTKNIIFDESNQVKTNATIINTGVVSHLENKNKFELSVKNINTEGCLEEKKGESITKMEL